MDEMKTRAPYKKRGFIFQPPSLLCIYFFVRRKDPIRDIFI